MHPSIGFSQERSFRLLPLQLLRIEEGVILKRGVQEICVKGGHVYETMQTILNFSNNSPDGLSLHEVGRQIPNLTEASLQKLFQLLLKSHFLVPIHSYQNEHEFSESHEDIFYWHFEKKVKDVTKILNKRFWRIFGVNTISQQLVASLVVAGLENFEVIDLPHLRNLRLFEPNGELGEGKWPQNLPVPKDKPTLSGFEPTDIVIATSDIGEKEVIRELNRSCLQAHNHFFPVILQDLIGYIGPLVIPGETACFECLQTRQNSHLSNPEVSRYIESQAFNGQFSVGFHPSMAAMLGNVAAFELCKHFGESLPKSPMGSLIEVNLLKTEMKTRQVIKVPRCSVCSTLQLRPATNFYEVFSNGDPR